MGSCFSSYQDQHYSAKASPSHYITRKSNVKEDEESSLKARILTSVKKFHQIRESNEMIEFSYQVLSRATSNFHPNEIIGDGGFGLVYKGQILLEDENKRSIHSMFVAVKKLNPLGYQGDREWLAEVNYLGSRQHQNLVKLIGHCCEGTERLLVYEYMAFGSLERHLFCEEANELNWKRRMKIILDVAKGLAFLHEADRPIIFRDFKTSNILLDEKLNAKISDFGLAKDGPEGSNTHVSTRVMGTYGYAAPEYIMTGKLTVKHDVYGFGVVLLEMLTGRTAIDVTRSSTEKKLVDFALPKLAHYNKLKSIIDPRIQGQYSRDGIHKIAVLICNCLNPDPKRRPFMNQIVQDLETI